MEVGVGELYKSLVLQSSVQSKILSGSHLSRNLGMNRSEALQPRLGKDNQKTKFEKKKQTASIKSHSKTHLSCDEFKYNNANSISEQLSLLNLGGNSSCSNQRTKRSDGISERTSLKQKHLKSYSFHDKHKDNNLNSVSDRFSQHNLKSSYSSRNELFKNDFEKHKKSNNRPSTSNYFNFDLFHSIAKSKNEEFDHIGNRRKRLGSQCSSLRSSSSSILSFEGREELDIGLETDYEKKNCHPDWRRKQFNNHPGSNLSNHFIKSCILKNDDSLTHTIMKNKDSFKNLFCTHRNFKDMNVIFKLLNRFCQINDPLTKEYFLSFSLNQQYIENTESYVSCILLGSSQDILNNLDDVLKLYSELVHVIPSENLNDYYELLTSCLDKMKKVSRIPDLMINNIEELISSYSEKLKTLNSQFDLSNLSILPLLDDVNEIPELQSNITTGPYDSVSHYLNVHFKLLKEDFVSNLRSGLEEYEENLKEKKSRIKNVFVYDGVYCGLVNHSRKANLAISFEINNKKLKKVEWGSSKRLIHGSLLLISNDNFKTYYLALVDDRKTPKSEDKHFIISALVVDKLIQFKKYTKCTIIEPRVFFNPYFQVLKTLKKIDPSIFPMEKYIIEADIEISPPSYLNNEKKYLIAGNEVNPYNITSYEFPEIFALNEFQVSALQAALTKEFVIIQGPPGTGKSYLGLKIINILLNNCSTWKKDASPILVICYRNNAVDQILESLIKDGKKIVRLGNQSNNELVKDCCLRNAVRPIHSGPIFWDKINTIKNQIGALKSQIAEMQLVIDSINDKKSVLSIDSLSDVMTVTQKLYLSESNVYEDWLFGGNDECDSNEDLLEDLLLGNSEYRSSINQSHSSFLLLSITDLLNELSDLRSNVNFFFSTYDPQSRGQEVLQKVVEILKEYDIKELFLRKVVNRINLEIDNFIDITQLNSDDLFELSIPERWVLYKHWADMFRDQCFEKIEDFLNQINEKQNTLDELNDMNDGHRILKLGPDVVGATTTGAARTRALLTTIQPKIVIFEEAAEVLECHTITALTQFCEHVIMIGDHQQLRPNPASHISTIKYKLDISLFERMIKNGIEYFTLNEQHRMRPLISSLVIPQFYPKLSNHTSVENYPDVRGVKDNMFFIDHNIPEDELLDSESHRNKHEANFILALADYILKQGYNKEDITILTFYGAQLFYLKAVYSNYPSLKGISMEVVDNFQGEENKIILLSLVRSNPFSIGFLSKMNRICVALTRAREGFYLIGNMTTLKGNSSVWKGIDETLQSKEVIGSELPLKCNTHGTITNVQTSYDFSPLVFGGCTLICGARLECGHACDFQCHGNDEYHLGTYSCRKPCERKAGCNIHDCKALCGAPCPKCNVTVETVLPCDHPGSKECEGGFHPCSSNCTDLLNCGHPCLKECHFPIPHLGEFCPAPCEKPNINCPFGHKCSKACGDECGECVVKTITTLPCGHTVNGKCNKIKNKKCKVLMEKTLDCGHTMRVQCYQFSSEVECTKNNIERLLCGHNIEVPCSRKTTEELLCKENVEKLLPCGHYITVACHLSCQDDLICEELVNKELKCGHGFQQEKCCTPLEDILCKKKVIKTVEECGHKIKLMCHVKPRKRLCRNPCKLVKPCGHHCSGMCGQICPECPEMVEIDQECGHKGFSPCAVITETKPSDKSISRADIKPSYGSLNCETLCKSILKCRHQCKGTCGKCMQGCIHETCVAACGAVLLCGHKCSNTCSLSIHLCDRKCLNKCKHQTCRNKCCESCQRCKQKCEWSCEHYQCTKFCWEECNRPICEASCKKLLPCGHNCNGFCGEPCPSVCFTCTPGNSESKYLLLEDCGHFISIEHFSAVISETVGLFVCPSCQQPQTSSHYIRYYTKRWFVLLPKIRRTLLNKYTYVRGLVLDTKSSIGRIHSLLGLNFDEFKQLKLLLKSIVESVKTILFKQNEDISIETLRSLHFVSYYITEAFQLLHQFNQSNDLYHLSRLNYLSSYLKNWETGISRDQMDQFKDELLRLIVICELKKIEEKNLTLFNKNNVEPIIKACLDKACRMEEFNYNKQKHIISLIKQIDSNAEINLNLFSSKFLSMFEKYYSLNLHRDCWLKCDKKGHIFYSADKTISDLKCPTCLNFKKEFLF